MYTQLQQRDSARPPVTLSDAARMKARRREDRLRSPATTPASRVLLDAAGVDVVLVGDSLGMVIQGHDTTVPVTMDQMVYHCAAVARGLQRPFLMADMPFMSYPSQEQALTNAVRLMQEGGAQMVKLESGRQAERDRRVPRRPRHRGVRPPRPQAAVGAQDRRLPRAGPRERGRGPHARGCARARGRGRRHACCSSAFPRRSARASPRRCTCR